MIKLLITLLVFSSHVLADDKYHWYDDPLLQIEHHDYHNYRLDDFERSNYQFQQRLQSRRDYEQREREIQTLQQNNQMFQNYLNSRDNYK